jgi:hypothetical protein
MLWIFWEVIMAKDPKMGGKSCHAHMHGLMAMDYTSRQSHDQKISLIFFLMANIKSCKM